MIRFENLEKMGLRAAAISDLSDGDCGFGEPGAETQAREARARFCRALGVDPAELVAARQVHGVHVAVVSAADRGRGAESRETALNDTDAIVTAETGLPIAVLVADCVPVALFDPEKRVAAVVHAGREGTLQDIAGAAVRTMSEAFGCKPHAIHAIIGPSAGPCCYEVSQEMADEFESLGLPRDGRMLDLWGGNERQLRAVGLTADKINVTRVCTICSGRLHSYRADGSRRRNMMLLMI